MRLLYKASVYVLWDNNMWSEEEVDIAITTLPSAYIDDDEIEEMATEQFMENSGEEDKVVRVVLDNWVVMDEEDD